MVGRSIQIGDHRGHLRICIRVLVVCPLSVDTCPPLAWARPSRYNRTFAELVPLESLALTRLAPRVVRVFKDNVERLAYVPSGLLDDFLI